MANNMDFEHNDGAVDETKVMPQVPKDDDAGAAGTSAHKPKIRVRPKSKAVKAIIDYLDANNEALPDDIGQFELNDAVIKAVDDLYDTYTADGIVPTREGFAECCEEPSIGRTVLDMPEDPFTRKAMSRRGIVAVCAGSVAALALVFGCVWWFTMNMQPDGGPDADTPTVAASAESDETDEDEGSPVSENEETESKSDEGSGNEEAEVESDEVSDDTASSNSDTGSTSSASSSGSGGSSASNPSGGSTGSTSSGSTGATGATSGGGSSSGGTSQSQPQHTHNWVAQTTTVHHDAVYQTVHHDAVTEERHICNGCGADITGNESAHLKENILNGCGGWHSEVVTVQAAYDEQVLVSAAYDETVVTGYTCSGCGATK